MSIFLCVHTVFPYFQISHSAYVDSPLGPDAFHEYESLLLQDYEELVKKTEKKALHSHQQNEIRQSAESDHQAKLVSDDDSWSQLASGEEYDTKFEASTARGRDDDSINLTEAEDGSTRLLVSVNHFPMVLCPISPRVFVLPSEGTVAEACLSNDHEDSLSPGLPSICTGLPSDGEDFPPGATLSAHFLYHLAAKVVPCQGKL